jgi:hypothetical protein
VKYTAADVELVVRLAQAALDARSNPGKDVTGMTDEELLDLLFSEERQNERI